MKICIAGKNNIAIDVCRYLIGRYGKKNICIIPNKTDAAKNTFQRSFLLFARQNGLEIVDLELIYDIPELIFFSLEFDQIIKPENFATSRLFNIHFSLLPDYKGMYTSALPIIHGENKSGVTLHCIDSGIDTGDIIAQKEIEIKETDTARDLYLKYIEEGTKLVIDHACILIEKMFAVQKQPAINSFYYSKKAIDYSSLIINQNVTAWQLSCQLRGVTFRDYQLPIVAGKTIISSEITENRSCQKPGTILVENETDIVVATVDYDIRLIKDQFNQLIAYCKEDNIDKIISTKYIDLYLKEQTELGWTLLMVAAYNNSKDVFKYLLSRGADQNATNYNGTTVLMYAKDGVLKSGDYETIEILLQSEVDVYAEDFNGKNVLDYLKGIDTRLFNYLKNRS